MTHNCGPTNYGIDHSRARVRVACGLLPPEHAARRAVQIEVEEPALRMALAHALSNRHEIAGFLIGHLPQRNERGQYMVRVSDYIAGQAVRSGPGSVTLTADTWALAHKALLERYAADEMAIIGWAHTHPNLTIFFSDDDRFLHRSFFAELYHIGLVTDPVRRQLDFYVYSTASEIVAYQFPWPQWIFESF